MSGTDRHQGPPLDTGTADIDTAGAPEGKKISMLQAVGKKSFVIFGLLGVGLLSVMLFFTLDHTGSRVSAVPPAPADNNVVGSHAVTPAYTQQVKAVDSQNYHTAVQTGTSAFPEPQFSAPQQNINGAPNLDPTSPAAETAPPQINATPQTNVAATTRVATAAPGQVLTPQLNDQQKQTPYDKALQDLFKPANRTGSVSFVVANDIAPPAPPAPASPGGPGSVGDNTQIAPGITLPVPGTLLSARMVNGLNSDDPGPAIAVITSGPLTGARVLGSFSTQRSGLVLAFQTMTIPVDDGASTKTVPITADAITLTDNAFASSVDTHLVGNLAVLFVTSLAGDVGNLLSTQGTSVAATNGSVLQSTPSLNTGQLLGAAAGQSLGQAGQTYEQLYGNRPVTIKLDPGFAFTLAFLGTSAPQSQGAAALPTYQPPQNAQPRVAPGYGVYGGIGQVSPYSNGYGYPTAGVP